MREFNYRKLDDYESRLLSQTPKVLVNNFNKVAKWITENCPNLNGKFECHHNPNYWIKLVVEDGKAYLECGSHGYGYDLALSTTETATFSRGSAQSTPNAFEGVQFFRSDRLEEFLSQWQEIKRLVIAKNEVQCNVYSEDFEA
jgi:hypothetical protein